MKKLFASLAAVLLPAFFFLQSFNLSASVYYWVGGSGDWSQNNTHWATTSGGLVFYLQEPGVNDTVIFDANSFTAPGQVVTVDSSSVIYCHTMVWDSTVHYNPTFSSNFNFTQAKFVIKGSLEIYTDSVQWYYYPDYSFEATTPGNKIRIGHHALSTVSFRSPGGGEWYLEDSINTYYFNIYGGNLHLNGQLIRCGMLQSLPSGYTSELYLDNSMVVSDRIQFLDPIVVHGGTSTVSCNVLEDFNAGNTYHIVDLVAYYTNSLASVVCKGDTIDQVNAPALGVIFGGYGNYVGSVRSLGDLVFYEYPGYAADYVRNLCVYNNLYLRENIILDTLSLFNPGYSLQLKAGSVQTINKAILTSSNSCASFVSVHTDVSGASAQIQGNLADTISCSNLQIEDVDVAGSTVFIADNSVSVSGTGWIVHAAGGNDLFWIGGQGSWSDSSHWSLTSGGAPYGCLPSQMSHVHFDTNSSLNAGDTVMIDLLQVNCNDFDVDNLIQPGVQFYSTSSVRLNIYGSLHVPAQVDWNVNGNIDFRAYDYDNTIDSKVQLHNLVFDGSGTVQLLDSLSCGALYHNKGKLITNGYNLRCNNINYQYNSPSEFDLGNSHIYALDTCYFSPAALIDADSAVISAFEFKADTGSFQKVQLTGIVPYRIPAGGAGMYGFIHIDTLIFSNGGLLGVNFDADYLQCDADMRIDGYNSRVGKMKLAGSMELMNDLAVDTLELDNGGSELYLKQGVVFTINDTVIQQTGCGGGMVRIEGYHVQYSSSPQAALKKASGTLYLQNVILKNVNATGGANFIADNSIKLTDVNGFTVNAPVPRGLYWVNGSGTWDDAAHWSLSSGGAGGECPPTAIDNVTIDDNSVADNDSIGLNSRFSYCKDMTWNLQNRQGILFTNAYHPPVNVSVMNSLSVNGDFILDSSLTWNYAGDLIFEGYGANKIINTAGNKFQQRVFFDSDSSGWQLQSDLQAQRDITGVNGSLNTNNYNFGTHADLLMEMDTVRFGASSINVFNCISYSGFWDADSASFTMWSLKMYYKTIGTLNGVDGVIGYPHNLIIYDMYDCHVNTINAETFFASFVDCSVDAMTLTNATIPTSNNTSFGWANVTGNLTMNGSTVFDTLLLNNPGKLVKLGAGTTLTVNDYLLINSAQNFPVTIQSDAGGTQANIFKANDTVCADYLNLRDINATGGAQFFAGLYSADQGNNSGWNFTACSLPFSNVWPGDANYDLVVDNNDILNIGLAFNEAGYVRPGATTAYTAQPCLDWNRVFTNQVNIKQADCTGDGIVDSSDVAVVNQNYGLTHPAFMANNPGNHYSPSAVPAEIYFSPSQTVYNPGDSVTIPVYIGTAANPASNLYGIAYTATYDNNFVVPGSITLTYPASWFTNAATRINFEKDFHASSKTDLALSRNNLMNANGYGQVALMRFKLQPGVTGSLPLAITGIKAISNDESILPFTGAADTLLVVNPVGINSYKADESINVFPTFTTDQVTVKTDTEGPIRIVITDLNGKVMKEITETGKSPVRVDLSDLSPAVYFANVLTVKGRTVCRVMKY